MLSGRMGRPPKFGRHILVLVHVRVYSGHAVAELLRLLLERHLSHGNRAPPDHQMLSHGRLTLPYLTSEPMFTYTVVSDEERMLRPICTDAEAR